jgi:hypothetical protein
MGGKDGTFTFSTEMQLKGLAAECIDRRPVEQIIRSALLGCSWQQSRAIPGNDHQSHRRDISSATMARIPHEDRDAQGFGYELHDGQSF